MTGAEAEPHVSDVAPDELAYLRSELDHYRSLAEALRAYALRIEPVCRNCIHAGPLTYTGNYPYNNDWASCREGAPGAGPLGKLGHWDQHTTSNPAHWPAVRATDTCGRFKLFPLAGPARDISSGYSEKWAYQQPQEPKP